jgi:hypothetical protein
MIELDEIGRVQGGMAVDVMIELEMQFMALKSLGRTQDAVAKIRKKEFWIDVLH